MDSTRYVAPDLYRRYLTIFFDGLRVDREALTALPVAALTVDQTHAVMTPTRPDQAQPDSLTVTAMEPATPA